MSTPEELVEQELRRRARAQRALRKGFTAAGGALLGGATGFAVAGPAGAVVGAVIGGIAGAIFG